MELTILKKLNRQNFNTVNYPERVIQFGTGVLLRGLVDYVINKANSGGVFQGSVVQIKSTGNGSGEEFARQDSLYTIALRGVSNGQLLQRYELNSCISRTINTAWHEVLKLAHDEHISLIVSNTTEAGIALDEKDSITKNPPASFPAKLLALLYERFVFFNGDVSKGYTIIPTELITNNGDELRSIVSKLAKNTDNHEAFIQWMDASCTFCNSLVDRIVTGKPTAEKLKEHWQDLSYEDNLLIECEPYLLWAIEGNETIKRQLNFALPGCGVVVESSIEKYRELKLRLLNGTHSFVCGMAFLKGFGYVKDAMRNAEMEKVIRNLLTKEIALSVNYRHQETIAFAEAVLERFENPFIEHKWLNITLNYTQKMAFRNVSNIQRYYQLQKQVPQYMAKGFAWYIRFMKAVYRDKNNIYYGRVNDTPYLINDSEAPVFYHLHSTYKEKELVKYVLGKTDWWFTNLNDLPGFTDAVCEEYETIKL
jgi:tagaturonate reductase